MDELELKGNVVKGEVDVKELHGNRINGKGKEREGDIDRASHEKLRS